MSEPGDSVHENLALQRFDVERGWRPDVLEAARRIADEAWTPESWRRDMTRWWTCSIDDDDTFDVDDALSWRPTIEGGWEVAIHIADPSALVDAGSVLDREARKAGASIYPPDGPIPMFPRVLSEDAMSLVEGALRPAITTHVIFDDRLLVEEVEIFPSVVQVDRRLSYDEADALLAGDATDDRVRRTLTGLKYIADELMRERMANDAVEINLPEAKVRVDRSGGEPRVSCELVDRSSSRSVVGELMIFANWKMAEFCDRHDIPIIYRVQDPPARDLSSDDIMSIPKGPARDFARVKLMCKADISTHPAPHAGLGLPQYVQASSPIRRYSDLVVQRQLKAFLADEPLPYDVDSIFDVASATEAAAHEAKVIERESETYWITYLLERRKGEKLDAVVVDYEDAGRSRATIFLTDYAFRANCEVRKAVPLGATLRVTVERADPRKDLLHLREA